MSINRLRRKLSSFLRVGDEPSTPPSAQHHLLTSNQPPTDEEAALMRSLIQTMKTDMENLEGEDEAGRRDLRDKIACHEAALSVIRRIPGEIIQHIFLLCDTSPWTLSQVCKDWRQHAHCLSALWSTLPPVTIDPEAPSAKEATTKTMKRLGAAIHYSSVAPLDIMIKVPTEQRQVSAKWLKAVGRNPVLALLACYSDRWRHVTLILPHEVVRDLTPSLQGQLANLETLILHFPVLSPYPQFDSADILAFTHVPRLRQLSVSGNFFGEIIIEEASNISRLTRSWPFRVGPPALAAFTGLQSLELDQNMMIYLTAAQLNSSSSTVHPITMPHLTTLSVTFCTEANAALLKSLTLPSLTNIRFDIAGPNLNVTQDLHAMLVRSGHQLRPTMRNLSLRNMPELFQPGQVLSLLRLMPELNELAISMPHVDDVCALAKTDYGPDELFLPKLQRCTFYFERYVNYQSGIPALGAAVRQMAYNRCELQDGDVTGGVHRLMMLQIAGHSFVESQSSLALSDPYAVPGTYRMISAPLYAQANFEAWTVSEGSDAVQSKAQQLAHLHGQLLNKIVDLYVGYRDEDELRDDVREGDDILNKIEALHNDGLGAFDVLTSNIHITFEKLVRALSKVQPSGDQPALDKAARLIEQWVPLIKPHLRDIHWFIVSHNCPHGDHDSERGLIYISADHPFRQTKYMEDAWMRGYDAHIYTSA